MPKWDLHLVLSALMSPPFPSEVGNGGTTYDEVIDLIWQTVKTVFLLALASDSDRIYMRLVSHLAGVYSEEKIPNVRK